MTSPYGDYELVVGLDSRDPTLDGHRQLQRMKLNPKVAAFLRSIRRGPFPSGVLHHLLDYLARHV
mgnify:CR=1 FL=1